MCNRGAILPLHRPNGDPCFFIEADLGFPDFPYSTGFKHFHEFLLGDNGEAKFLGGGFSHAVRALSFTSRSRDCFAFWVYFYQKLLPRSVADIPFFGR